MLWSSQTCDATVDNVDDLPLSSVSAVRLSMMRLWKSTAPESGAPAPASTSPSSAMEEAAFTAEAPPSIVPPPTSSVLLPFVDPPLLSSTLQKRSPATPALWQIRHFILYPDVLLYSQSCSPSSVSAPLGLIPLSSIIYVTALPSFPLRFDFLIQAEKATHTFQLMTTSPALTQQWVKRMKRLTRAGHAGRVEDVWYDRRGKFWKSVHQLAMQRRVRRAQADYAQHHPTIDVSLISQPLLSGWLRKRSPAFLHVWQGRFFALYPSVLVYCKAESGGLLGAVALLSVLWMDCREERRLDVAVEDEDGTGVGRERLLQLQMDTDTERDTWHRLIQQQMSIIKQDHTHNASSASLTHSRSASDGGGEEPLDRAGEEKPDEDSRVQPSSAPLILAPERSTSRLQRTPYHSSSTGAAQRSVVPTLKQSSPAVKPPPASHAQTSPSLLPFPSTSTRPPASPLSVVLLSRSLHAQKNPALLSAASVPPAPPGVAPPSDPAPASSLSLSSDRELALPDTPTLSRSSSCYTSRPTSAHKRPLIKVADKPSPTLQPTPTPTPSPPPPPPPSTLTPSIILTAPFASRTSRSRSGSHSSSTPSPPPNGLLDDGVLLTLFHYNPTTSTLSFSDRILAYDPDGRIIRSRLPDGLDTSTAAAQSQLDISVAVDDLDGATIGRASPTLQRLSVHISDECCLALSCRTGQEVNVVAKGATLIKLLHKELMGIIEGEDEDGLHPQDEHAEADDKLDDDAAAAPLQRASPSLLPYAPQLPAFPSLSAPPALTRSRSAPVGTTLRFQERIEVHEYIAPASYTPSEEDALEERREVDLEDDDDSYDDDARDLHTHLSGPIEDGEEGDDFADPRAAPLWMEDGDDVADASSMAPVTFSPLELSPRMEAQKAGVTDAGVRAEAEVVTDVAAVTQHHPLSSRLSSVIAQMKLPDFSAQGLASAMAQRRTAAEPRREEDDDEVRQAEVQVASEECVLGLADDVPMAPPLAVGETTAANWREEMVEAAASPAAPAGLKPIISAVANPAAASLAAIFQQRAMQQRQQEVAEAEASEGAAPPLLPPPTAPALEVVEGAGGIPTPPPPTPSPRPSTSTNSPSAPPAPSSPAALAKAEPIPSPTPASPSPSGAPAPTPVSPSPSSLFGVRLRSSGSPRPSAPSSAPAPASPAPAPPISIASARQAAPSSTSLSLGAALKQADAPALTLQIPSPRGSVVSVKSPTSAAALSPSAAPDAAFVLPDSSSPSQDKAAGSNTAASAVTAPARLSPRPSTVNEPPDIPAAPLLALNDNDHQTTAGASPIASGPAREEPVGTSNGIPTAPPLTPPISPKVPGVSILSSKAAASPSAPKPPTSKAVLVPSPSAKAAASPLPAAQASAPPSASSTTPSPSSTSSLSIPSSISLGSLPTSPSLARVASTPPAAVAPSLGSTSALLPRAPALRSPRQSVPAAGADASVGAVVGEQSGDGGGVAASAPASAVPAGSRVSVLRSMWQQKA